MKTEKQFSPLMILILLVSLFSSKALELDVIQMIPSVMTNVQIADYDFDGTGMGPTIFKLIINNKSDSQTYTNVQITYTLNIYCDINEGQSKAAYKGRTAMFTIEAGSYTEILSNDFLMEDNPRTPVHIQHVIENMDDDQLVQKVFDSGTLPTGQIILSFELTSSTATMATEPIIIDIHNPNRVDLISPGVESQGTYTDDLPEYLDPALLFTWSSDLTANMYETCNECDSKDVFEFHIYRKRPGESESDALSRQPIIKERLRTPSYQMFTTGKLERGATYYWRVYGLLQGVVNAKLESRPFVFRYGDYYKPDVNEIKRLLKSILAISGYDQYIPIVDEYDKEILLYQDGIPYSLEELQELEQRLLSGEKEIFSVTVE